MIDLVARASRVPCSRSSIRSLAMKSTVSRHWPALTVCPFTRPSAELNSTSPADELSIMGDHVLEGKEEHRRYYHKRRNRELARS